MNTLLALSGEDIEIVGVNDLTDNRTLAHLLKYDSILGRLDADVTVTDTEITVNGKSIRALSESDPSKLPWGELGADIVIESTGRFTDRDAALLQVAAGGQEGPDLGPGQEPRRDHRHGREPGGLRPGQGCGDLQRVVHHELPGPDGQVIQDSFGIEWGLMTTIHAYTNDQVILDARTRTCGGPVPAR